MEENLNSDILQQVTEWNVSGNKKKQSSKHFLT